MREHPMAAHQPSLSIIAVTHRRLLWAQRTDVILQCDHCGEITRYTVRGHLSIEDIRTDDCE